ncbi:hypothetical protein LWV19_001135 [Salmonella enterica]|nr:hypothetical protein [Salmonella enterica]
MKMMINFSRIKARLCFELQAFKKATREALPEMIATLTNGLTLLIYAFFYWRRVSAEFFLYRSFNAEVIMKSGHIKKSVELTNQSKLESTIETMLRNFNHRTDNAMKVIGRTPEEVITITIYSRNGFEFKFNQRIEDIDGRNICLSIIRPPCFPPY